MEPKITGFRFRMLRVCTPRSRRRQNGSTRRRGLDIRSPTRTSFTPRSASFCGRPGGLELVLVKHPTPNIQPHPPPQRFPHSSPTSNDRRAQPGSCLLLNRLVVDLGEDGGWAFGGAVWVDDGDAVRAEACGDGRAFAFMQVTEVQVADEGGGVDERDGDAGFFGG